MDKLHRNFKSKATLHLQTTVTIFAKHAYFMKQLWPEKHSSTACSKK